MRKLVLFLSIVTSMYATGQPLSSTPLTPTDSIAHLYFASQEGTLPIYNGRVFYGYAGIKEHGFFPVNGWQKGSVLFDGIWYHDISLMYDVYKDELITLHPNTTPVRLFTERVQQFNFGGLYFVRLSADKDNVVKNQLYQRLVEGDVTIFVRRNKKIEDNIVDLGIEKKFVTTDQYYVLKDGVYHPIYKQKNLLELLKDSKSSINQHLKQKGLKFKKAKEETIVEIAQFYNQSHKK